MLYKVLDTFLIGANTSVTLDGNGKGLKNNITVYDDNGITHNLLSVAMVSERDAKAGTVTVLIEGEFKSNTVRI